MPLRIVIDARRIRDFGIGTYTRNLVRSLARIDHFNQYNLIARPEDLDAFPPLGSNFELAAFPAPAGPLGPVASRLFLARFSAHLYHLPYNVVPSWMPGPYVVTVHDVSNLLYGQQEGLLQSWRIYRANRGLRRAAQVVAVSAATQRDIINLLGIPQNRIRLIYSAPDPLFTGPRASAIERAHMLERYQIQYPFLLYAGTIRPYKNIPRLIEAFAALRGELEQDSAYHDLRLIIIGDEVSRHPDVRRTVIRNRLENFVRFLGFVPIETLRLFYQAALAFVFPSLYEGFGLPPLEAMASGTPVITSAVSSLPEAAGDAAMLVNPENVFDIARGMREVLFDNRLRATLIEKGLRRAATFQWDRTAEQTLEVYQRASNPNRA